MTVTAAATHGLAESISLVKPLLGAEMTGPDIVDVWGDDSFPASDPPANW